MNRITIDRAKHRMNEEENKVTEFRLKLKTNRIYTYNPAAIENAMADWPFVLVNFLYFKCMSGHLP